MAGTIGNAASIYWMSLARMAGALRRDKAAFSFLLVLLLVDLIFFAIHIAYGFYLYFDLGQRSFSESRLAISTDWSYAEIFNYVQTLLAAGFLLQLFVRTQRSFYLSWGIIFLIVVLDDSMEIHETLGYYLTSHEMLPSLFGLDRYFTGELLANFLIGLVVLGFLLHAFAHRDPRRPAIGYVLFTLLCLLAFFALGVDFIHALLMKGLSGGLSGFVEDGGEMVTISLTAAITLLESRHVLARGAGAAAATAAPRRAQLSSARRLRP